METQHNTTQHNTTQHNTTLEVRIDRIEENVGVIANTMLLLLEEMRKFNNRDNNLNANFKSLEVGVKRVKIELAETKEEVELRELTDLIDSNQKIGNKEFKNLGIIVKYSPEKLDPKDVKIPLCEKLESYVKNNKDKSKMILSLGDNGTGKNHSVEQIAKMDNAVLIKIRGSANKEENEKVKRIIDHLFSSLANKKNVLLLVDEVDPKKGGNDDHIDVNLRNNINSTEVNSEERVDVKALLEIHRENQKNPKFNVDFMLMNSIYDRYMDPANVSSDNKIKLTLVMNGNNPRAFNKDQTGSASDTTQKNTFLSRVTRCDFDKPNLSNMKKAIPFIVAENIQDKKQQAEVINYLNKKCDETLNGFIDSKIKDRGYLENAVKFYQGGNNQYSELDVYINNDESIKKDVTLFKKLLEDRRIYDGKENQYRESVNKLNANTSTAILSLQQKLIESVNQNYPIDIRQVKKWLDEYAVPKDISLTGNGLNGGKKK